MINRNQIVEAARAWKGTPYRHGGRVRGLGCDCAGPVVGVAMELGIPVEDLAGYSPKITVEEMDRILETNFERIDPAEAQPGDILQMELVDGPRHLAIVTDAGIIHTSRGLQKVVEHRLDRFWRERIRAAWRYRIPEI
jgi:cell wall-associated NlpC family hydrolase